MSKRESIRKEVLAKRSALSTGDIEAASLKAAEHFISSDLYQSSQRFGLFMSHNGELSPNFILSTALQAGRECYLPTLDPVTENTLIFVNYSKGESLVKNRYQILEPVIKPTNVIGAKLLDVVLVPLVGIDRRGNRLGMGKGFYDRTFGFKNAVDQKIKPILVGFCYEFQICPLIENKSWDVPMDYLVTERQLYTFIKGTETLQG